MANETKLKAQGWNLCPDTFGHQVTATTYKSHKLHECPIDSLPKGLRAHPGLESVYLSSYFAPIEALPCLTATGEFVTIRYDDELTKSYNFVFAVSDDQRVFYSGPYKKFDLHHIAFGEPISIEKLFGNNPIYNSSLKNDL
jgi:hypothetical protein